MPGLEAVRVLCSILIITNEHMYFPEVFCSFVCFVALCVGGVGGQWTDETALCEGQRTNQVSVPSSLGQGLCCLPLQGIQEANGPASIWESPVSSPISLWEH